MDPARHKGGGQDRGGIVIQLAVWLVWIPSEESTWWVWVPTCESCGSSGSGAGRRGRSVKGAPGRGGWVQFRCVIARKPRDLRGEGDPTCPKRGAGRGIFPGNRATSVGRGGETSMISITQRNCTRGGWLGEGSASAGAVGLSDERRARERAAVGSWPGRGPPSRAGSAEVAVAGQRAIGAGTGPGNGVHRRQ